MAQASSGSCFPLPVGFVLARARSPETAPAFRQEPGIMNSRSSGRRPQVALGIGPCHSRSGPPARPALGRTSGRGRRQLAAPDLSGAVPVTVASALQDEATYE